MKHHLLVLPYKGSDAMHIIISIWKKVNCALPDDVEVIVSYTGKKLGTCFNVKDKTVFNQEHDILYYAKCPEESCPHDYVRELGRRVLEQVKDIMVEIIAFIFFNIVQQLIISLFLVTI